MKKLIIFLTVTFLSGCSGSISIPNENMKSSQQNFELNYTEIRSSARKVLVKECKDQLNYYYNVSLMLSDNQAFLESKHISSKSAFLKDVKDKVFGYMLYILVNNVSKQEQRKQCMGTMEKGEAALIKDGIITEKNRTEITKKLKRNTLGL